MTLRTGIRLFRQDDWEAVYAWVKDPEIKDNFRFTQKNLTPDDMKKFVQLEIENDGSKSLSFVLYDKADPVQQYIGSVSLKNIDKQDYNAELAIVIGSREYRGKGYGQEALYLICEYGFKILGLHKVYLTCVAHNFGAVKSYERFGFVHEGLRKEQIFQNGQYYDEVMMGILEEAFVAKYAQ